MANEMTAYYSSTADGDEFVLRDQANEATARILVARGNNVTHFTVRPKGRRRAEDVFMPPSGPSGLGASGYSAGNPILFPFPNRVKGGQYVFEGKTYQLDVNETARGNHIHGLVSNLPWETDDSGTDQASAWHRASIQLHAFPDVVRQFPFPCHLTVTTRLGDGALTQEINVHNVGSGRLPMGYGTHPWFAASRNGGLREDTCVRVPGQRYWELRDLVPTGKTTPVNLGSGVYDLRAWRELNGLDLDDVFSDLVRRPDGWSEAGIRYPNARLELKVEASPEFREWVIFAPTSRPVVCLEPYAGTTNAINLQNEGVDAGLVVLEPGAHWQAIIRTSLIPHD